MRNLSALTDLYQLTMLNGYFKLNKLDDYAVFDLFFRQNEQFSYSIAGGLAQAIEYIQNLSFTDEDIAYIRQLNLFEEDFLTYLKTFRFTGNIYAVPEGSVVFPQEPILTIEAPLLEAQFVETALLNIINHQTLIATKSAKICHEANGKEVFELGARRAQGPDAAIYGARAAMLGGCSATSNIFAGKAFNIPVVGTHAHAWVMSFDSELEAFRAYAKLYPNNCTLLVDTYNTLKSGVPNAIQVFHELRAKGYTPKGIRLDSGDLAYLSKEARKMLDSAGFTDVKIIASGDLDEHIIASLQNQGAKIDIYGVGTKLITSANMPALGGVYKLVELRPKNQSAVYKIKLSNNINKLTTPAMKVVYRIYNKETNEAEADLIALQDEVIDCKMPLTITHPTERWKQHTFTNYSVKKLTKLVMKNGKLVEPLPTLQQSIAYAKQELNSFCDEYKRLDNPHVYKVDLSDKLYTIKNNLIAEIKDKNG